MKYRIWPRAQRVKGKYSRPDGTPYTKHTTVYEIQKSRWWGWEYVETWSRERDARDRLLELTGPDRPIFWFEVCVRAIRGKFAELATRVKKQLSNTRGA